LGARATGKGRDIDTSLFDVALHNINYLGTWYLNEGVKTVRLPRSAHPSLTPSQLYRTGDGWMFIMCNKEKFWGILCNIIGRPEWIDDPRYRNFGARLENRDQLTEDLDAVLSTRTTAEWMQEFAGKVPAAPVYDVAQALDNPYAREQRLIVDVPHPARGTIQTLACPIRCPGDELPTRPAPRLGEHTEEVLRRVRDDNDWIGGLVDRRIV
ncbi:MAG: CoA transferase, partial [Candidatus Promineofilum sp.]|nr:CoA transferase [Promineifilum sp.]